MRALLAHSTSGLIGDAAGGAAVRAGARPGRWFFDRGSRERADRDACRVDVFDEYTDPDRAHVVLRDIAAHHAQSAEGLSLNDAAAALLAVHDSGTATGRNVELSVRELVDALGTDLAV